VVVDVGTRVLTERRVEDEFLADPRLDVDLVSFSVDSFPFVGRLAAQGEVSATLRLEQVVQQGVRIDEFALEVDGLAFDRGAAVRGEVVVTGLDRATTSIRLTEGTLSELLGVPVSIGPDGTVTAEGVAAEVSAGGGDLVLTGAFGTITVPVPVGRYLPCEPDVEVVEDAVVARCVTDTVPPVVNRVLG
jgi:hypothetical protein